MKPLRQLVRIVLGFALLLVLQATAGPASAQEYLLGPQDRVRLKIYEWRASRDVIFEWTALNDEFTVGADGALSLPFVGTVPAAGMTPAAMAGIIAQRLVRHIGLGQAPDVAVEVVQFRPFYIVGHVTQPGEYPYRPGLTVLQAMSIAGGLRTREEGAARVEREVIAGRGELDLLTLSHLGLIARRARLRAEFDNADEIEFPSAWERRPGDAVADVLMQQERAVFEARQQGLATQLRALSELRSFLEREAESLERQLELLDGQIASLDEELGTVTSLVDQGLAVAPRQTGLERAVLQSRSDRLAAETALLRARQEISRTELSILELGNNRKTEVASELREVEAQLGEIERRTDTALLLLQDSEALAPRLLAMRAEAANAEPTYTILRPTGSGLAELAATEATPVQPGDTIKVTLPLPSADLSAATAALGAPVAGAAAGSGEDVVRR